MNMGKVATVSVLALAVAWAMPALSDVVVENDAFKLVVGDGTVIEADGLKYFETSLSAAAVRTAFAKATVAQVAPSKE